MNRKGWFWLSVVLALLLGYVLGDSELVNADFRAQALSSTAFTYQGHLQEDGQPAQGAFDFRFVLYDAESEGTALGEVEAEDVAVSGGVFSVLLDFGAQPFSSGAIRYLEVAVRPGDSTGDYTVLNPRQALTRVPYAQHASVADSALQAQSVPWGGITGRPEGLDDGDGDTQYSAGQGLTLSNLKFALDTDFTDARYKDRFWSTVGNAVGSSGATLGTTDGQAWDMVVNNATVIRLEPRGNSVAVVYAQDADPDEAVVVGKRYRDNAIVAWGEVGWNNDLGRLNWLRGLG